MSYNARIESSSEIYHVMCRGVGRQIIFEDDDDRSYLIERIAEAKGPAKVEILAWCLMDNHFHLLARAAKDDLASFMQKVLSAYAKHFNERHNRVGHLFQDRFKSVPIESDSQLLAVVRYIHQNPVELGKIDYQMYPWSSYREYLGAQGLAETGMVLEMYGSLEEFDRFNQYLGDDVLPSFDSGRIGDSMARALFIAHEELGADIENLKSLPRNERDAGIERLLRRGLSIRQIERLTSISRGIIARISKNLNG